METVITNCVQKRRPSAPKYVSKHTKIVFNTEYFPHPLDLYGSLQKEER